MLGWDLCGQTVEFVENALDLALRFHALQVIQLDGGASQPTIRPAGDRRNHLQIAQQGGDSVGWRIGFALPLRLQKQLRLFQDALADGRRSVPPRGIELSGFAAGEAVHGERLRHALAVLGTGARHRHQELHGEVGGDGAAAHLLLHAAGKQFDQRQPARYPTQATIETARQLLHAIAETPLQFRQQPALFQRRRPLRHAQRTV